MTMDPGFLLLKALLSVYNNGDYYVIQAELIKYLPT